MRKLFYLILASTLIIGLSIQVYGQEEEEPVNYYQMEPLDDSLFIQNQEQLFIDPPDPKAEIVVDIRDVNNQTISIKGALYPFLSLKPDTRARIITYPFKLNLEESITSSPGAPKTTIYYEARSDGRAIMVLPWTGRYLIGSTDLYYKDDLDYVRMDDDELDYLVKETNILFPSADLTPEKVIYSYSGIRPLPYVEGKSTVAVTRRHIIYDHSPEVQGLISIVGGKLTTFRNLAEQSVDLVYKKLGRPSPSCSPHNLPLPGAVSDLESFRRQFMTHSGLPATRPD